MDGAGQVAEPPHLSRPLHERPGERGEVRPQQGLGEPERLIVLARGHEQRGAGALGVVEHPERVAEPGGHVDVHDAQPAGGLRVPVGHREDRRLLEPQHVPDVGLDGEGVHQRQLGRARVAEEHGDALLAQEGEKGLLAGEDGHRQRILAASLLMRSARQAAPKPLSTFTTATPGTQVASMVSSAAKPPRATP